MQLNSINNITFQKKLMATCKILKSGEAQNAYIYKLDNIKDRKIYESAFINSDWENNCYLDLLYYDFLYKDISRSHYVMEDEKQKPLCFALTRSKPKQTNLETIETAPRMSLYNKKRSYKYIGETMLAFLVGLAKKENKKTFFIPSVVEKLETKEFYFNQCEFDTDTTNEAWLEQKKFDNMLKLNSKHTNSTINFTC